MNKFYFAKKQCDMQNDIVMQVCIWKASIVKVDNLLFVLFFMASWGATDLQLLCNNRDKMESPNFSIYFLEITLVPVLPNLRLFIETNE